MEKIITSVDKVVEELFRRSPENERCPHIRKDYLGAYCSKNLKEGENIDKERRYVCSACPLDIWCLNKEKYSDCMFYQGEQFIQVRLV
ncbi:hypothetical protein J4229_01250 [Candidatus Pacearchaeota archaeon]|nr:hypothetical protein [Candidatus Pacearchaeota archaeon]